jgi:hypothetical protein
MKIRPLAGSECFAKQHQRCGQARSQSKEDASYLGRSVGLAFFNGSDNLSIYGFLSFGAETNLEIYSQHIDA